MPTAVISLDSGKVERWQSTGNDIKGPIALFVLKLGKPIMLAHPVTASELRVKVMGDLVESDGVREYA